MFLLGLGILAGILQVTGYALYYIKLYQGGIKPRIASWSMWTFGGVVGSLSYGFMTADWPKRILPIVCLLCCASILWYALRQKNYEPMKLWEKRTGKVYVVAAIVALITPAYGSIVQQVGTLVSFAPTIEGVCREPKTERSLPWFVWSLAYGILLAICLIKFERWEELVYPINCLALHLAVGLLALRRPRTHE